MPGDLGSLHGRVPVAGTVVYCLGFVGFSSSGVGDSSGLELAGDACPGSIRTGSRVFVFCGPSYTPRGPVWAGA